MSDFEKLNKIKQREVLNALLVDGLSYQEIENEFGIDATEIADIINERAVKPYNAIYKKEEDTKLHSKTVWQWCFYSSLAGVVAYLLVVFIQSALGGFESQITTDSIAFITNPLAKTVYVSIAVCVIVILLKTFFPILPIFINEKVNTVSLKSTFLESSNDSKLNFLAKIFMALCLLVGLIFSAKAQEQTKRDCIIQTAKKEIGTLETGGNNKGQRIDFYRSVSTGKTIKGYSDAWCGYFVSYVFNTCKIPTNGVKFPPRARDWFFDPKYIVWQKNRQYSIIKKKPQKGCLIGYKFKAGNIGHIEILDEWKEDHFTSIGGNTSNKGSVYRDANSQDGVRYKKRSIETAYIISDYIN